MTLEELEAFVTTQGQRWYGSILLVVYCVNDHNSRWFLNVRGGRIKV